MDEPSWDVCWPPSCEDAEKHAESQAMPLTARGFLHRRLPSLLLRGSLPCKARNHFIPHTAHRAKLLEVVYL